MAVELDHIELANRNHETLAFLVPAAEAHSEWVATIAFYKAVQVVEAVFANHLRIHSHGHDSRIEELKRPIFADLYRAFRPLYGASLVARYLEDSSSKKLDDNPGPTLTYRRFSDYIPANAVVQRLLSKRLQALEQHSLPFLSEDARSKLKRIHHVLYRDSAAE